LVPTHIISCRFSCFTFVCLAFPPFRFGCCIPVSALTFWDPTQFWACYNEWRSAGELNQ
jgi:hypothetical protein